MSADRIFLDANILFSISFGAPGLTRLWEYAKKNRCLLFASNYVAEEARRNLSASEQNERLRAFLSQVQIVPEVDPLIPCPIDLPARDQPVLLAAISIKADYLHTGDVLYFGKYFGQTIHGVKVCRPGDYFPHQPSDMEKD